MLLAVILTLVLLLIIYLLWMPVEIGIDTATNKYYLQLKGLAKASIEAHEAEILRVKFRVFFFKFYFYPLRRKSPDKIKKIESGEKKKKKRKRTYDVRKIMRVVRSFKVKKFLLDLDTGDYTLNAKLYPVFTGLNFTKGEFLINFEGRNRLALLIRNRPIHIIKSFINF